MRIRVERWGLGRLLQGPGQKSGAAACHFGQCVEICIYENANGAMYIILDLNAQKMNL
jgi:hypothetical protein